MATQPRLASSSPWLISGHIYLGNGIHAASLGTLKQLNIHAIVNATCELVNYWEPGVLDNLWEACRSQLNVGMLLAPDGESIDERLQAIREWVKSYNDVPDFEYLNVLVRDAEDQDLMSHLPTFLTFIRKNISQGHNIMVHCNAGVSRSVSLVCAYLIEEHKKSFCEALAQIQRIRPEASPNPGFVQQLESLALQ
jgi:hypothetical protein